MPYFKLRGCQVSQGNLKLGRDTLIINMGSAKDCPSKRLGFCKLGLQCYAHKAEVLYKNVEPYRNRQAAYWVTRNAGAIASDLIDIINKLNKKSRVIKYIRFNESGDFYHQKDVQKLDKLASYVFAATGVIFYGYTARKDLDFTGLCFHVKGSSNDAGNNGRTIARHPDKLDGQSAYIEAGTQFARCPGDCRTCNLCKVRNGINIVFPLH